LEPDPNNPDEDTFVLHFPHAAELVECREFWARHLAELLSEYAASELARLRAERDQDAKAKELFVNLLRKAEAERDRLRITVEWIAGQTDLFFAECSRAEEIVWRCKEVLK
jgi:hypothetical protein